MTVPVFDKAIKHALKNPGPEPIEQLSARQGTNPESVAPDEQLTAKPTDEQGSGSEIYPVSAPKQ